MHCLNSVFFRLKRILTDSYIPGQFLFLLAEFRSSAFVPDRA
jgi:hypothetical protein